MSSVNSRFIRCAHAWFFVETSGCHARILSYEQMINYFVPILLRDIKVNIPEIATQRSLLIYEQTNGGFNPHNRAERITHFYKVCKNHNLAISEEIINVLKHKRFRPLGIKKIAMLFK